MPKKNLLVGEELTESDLVKIEELEQMFESDNEVVEETPVKHSIMDAFVWEKLKGSDEFKSFVSQYVHEYVKIDLEKSDLNYYDWLFHQYLKDSFIEYAVKNLDKIQHKHMSNDSNEFNEIIGYFESIDFDFSKLTWFDIFCYIRDLNADKNFGRYVMESVKNA